MDMEDKTEAEELDNFAEEIDFINESELEIDGLIPSKMEVHVSKEDDCIIENDKLLNLYDEVLANCRSDRQQAEELMMNFFNMVMNEGESSSATKEAVVNLLKIKTDISDKMTKIADLETRIKLKEKDTYPRYLAAQQNNKIVFDNKRKFLQQIEKKLGEKDGK